LRIMPVQHFWNDKIALVIF